LVFLDRSRIWDRAVSDYTNRQLSHKFDKLPAILGFASKVQQLLHCKHLAGIWEYDLYDLMLCCGEFERGLPQINRERCQLAQGPTERHLGVGLQLIIQ